MTRILRGMVLALLVTGCASSNTKADAGPNPACAPLYQNLQDLLSTTQICSVDSDCVNDTLPCGLVDQCFASVSMSNVNELDAALAQLEDEHCEVTGSSCSCQDAGPAGCSSGLCTSTPFDAGPNDDGGPIGIGPDEDGGNVCISLLNQIVAFIDGGSMPCSSTEDCVVVPLPCEGNCSEPVAVTAATESDIFSVENRLLDEGCLEEVSTDAGTGIETCPCSPTATAACIRGECETLTDGGTDGGFQ